MVLLIRSLYAALRLPPYFIIKIIAIARTIKIIIVTITVDRVNSTPFLFFIIEKNYLQVTPGQITPRWLIPL